MNSEQSKKLKVGNRVCIDGDTTDDGKVAAVQFRYVTINGNDGHQSFTGRKNMARIEQVK